MVQLEQLFHHDSSQQNHNIPVKIQTEIRVNAINRNEKELLLWMGLRLTQAFCLTADSTIS